MICLANEAVILQTNNLEYRQGTVADGSAWAKGTVMIFTITPNTLNSHTSHKQFPAGILAVEKVASDGQTTVPILVSGDVTAIADGTVAIGDIVCVADVANRFRTLGAVSIEKLTNIAGVAVSGAGDGIAFTLRLKLG